MSRCVRIFFKRIILTHHLHEIFIMASLDTLILAYKLYSTVYLQQHEYESYRGATTFLLKKLHEIKVRTSTAKEQKATVSQTTPDLIEEQLANIPQEIARLVTLASEMAKKGFVMSKPKYAKDLQIIYDEWMLGKFNEMEANEIQLQRKVQELTDANKLLNAENQSLKAKPTTAVVTDANEAKKEDPKDEHIRTLKEVNAASQKTIAEQSEKIRKLEAELLAARATASIATLPQLGMNRVRSHSDTSSNHSAQSMASTTANQKAYLESAEKILGAKRFALVNRLMQLTKPEAKQDSSIPYSELIGILCRDALFAFPKNTNELVTTWINDKHIKNIQFPITLSSLENLDDKPNPRHYVQENRKRYDAGHLLGYAIQKGFLGQEKPGQPGFIDINLGKELGKIKPSAAVPSNIATDSIVNPMAQLKATIA